MLSNTKNKTYLVNTVVFCTVLVTILIKFASIILADSVTTTVVVGNGAPAFSVDPADNDTLTNVGSTVPFTATATDGNGDNYYLAICQGIGITANNNAAPDCGATSFCVSSSTATGVEASCSYTTLAGDSETEAWYAYVCDHNASSLCSAYSQGTGTSGTPFEVNHAPSFSAINSDSPQDPGSNVTWTTGVGTSDSDTNDGADTVMLIICKTTGLGTGTTDCDGGSSDRWCYSGLGSTAPSCSYSVPIPTADAAYAAYAYVVDNHAFGPTGGNQGIGTSYVVNNVAPVISAVTVNSGVTISLGEGVTTPVVLSATATDNNGVTDISTVTGDLYRSGIGNSACDNGAEDDYNSCYAVESCSVGATTTSSGDYTCTVNMQYFADPTDAGTSFPDDTWLDTIVATDDDAAVGSTEVTTGVELESTVALDVTASIDYGSMSVGQTMALTEGTTVEATGNVGLDEELSGADMLGVGDTSNTIAVGYQKYHLTESTAYGAGTTLTVSATEVELNCRKTTVLGTGETKATWWGLEIPNGTVADTYGGSNDVTAVKAEVADWY